MKAKDASTTMPVIPWYLAAPATAIAANLAGAPLEWAFAALFVFVPLFTWYQKGPGARFLTGWLAGFLNQAIAYPWIYNTIRDFSGQSPTISALGTVLFWAYQGLDLALWLWLAPMVVRNMPRLLQPFGASGCWVLLQTLLFPYVFLWQAGGLFTGSPLLHGGAVLWGATGLAFWAIAGQGLVVIGGLKHHHRLPAAALILALILAGNLFKGEIKHEVWRIGIVQPNLIPEAKREAFSMEDIFLAHYALTVELARENLDLIIWPETALSFNLDKYTTYVTRLRNLIDTTDTPLITGTLAYEKRQGYYNEIRLYEPGDAEPQKYRKYKLVMFSERLPWIFSWARKFDAGIGGFIPGQENQPFNFKNRQILPLVCFEALFPEYVFGLEGHLIVNLTNDAWFGPTKASSQHLQMIRTRAVEHRIPLIRATNSGISGWVDHHGEIRQRGGLYQRETLVMEVPIPLERPLRYSRLGTLAIHALATALALWGLVLRLRGLPRTASQPPDPHLK